MGVCRMEIEKDGDQIFSISIQHTPPSDGNWNFLVAQKNVGRGGGGGGDFFPPKNGITSTRPFLVIENF